MSITDKLTAEAAAAGLLLLGVGRNRQYRAYRWVECGHEAEYQAGDVRIGRVRCQQCLDAKRHADASAAGLVLVGPGRDRNYRAYRWIECGHEAEYTMNHVSKSGIRCQQCLDAKLHTEAATAGLELIGPHSSRHHRMYRWAECGHEYDYAIHNVRSGRVRCQQCLDENLRAEANAVGLVLLRAGKDRHYRTYRWAACGHEAEYHTGSVRTGRVGCQRCFDSKLRTEAAAAGVELVGPGRNAARRTYRWLDCGHNADYQIGAVRRGHACCQQCEATHWSKPSNVYVLVLTDGPNAWVKVGSSKRTETRISDYGLPAGVEVQIVHETPTATGEAAYRIEQDIKDSFAAYRLDPTQMRVWHRSNGGGATECYQIAALDQILAAVAQAFHRWSGDENHRSKSPA